MDYFRKGRKIQITLFHFIQQRDRPKLLIWQDSGRHSI